MEDCMINPPEDEYEYAEPDADENDGYDERAFEFPAPASSIDPLAKGGL
jgi:hypothetical protein